MGAQMLRTRGHRTQMCQFQGCWEAVALDCQVCKFVGGKEETILDGGGGGGEIYPSSCLLRLRKKYRTRYKKL